MNEKYNWCKFYLYVHDLREHPLHNTCTCVFSYTCVCIELTLVIHMYKRNIPQFRVMINEVTMKEHLRTTYYNKHMSI